MDVETDGQPVQGAPRAGAASVTAAARARVAGEWQAGEAKDISAAAALYAAATAHGGADCAELGRAAGLECDRTSAGWRTLQEMGLVRIAGDRMEAVDPEAGLAEVMGCYTAAVEEQVRNAFAAQDAAHELLTVFRPAAGEQEPLAVDEFTGPGGLDWALRDIVSRSRETLDAAYQELSPAGTERLARAARCGIRVRALYPRTVLGVPVHARVLEELTGHGISVRLVDHVSHELLIFDRATVCLPGGPGDISESMIRIKGAAAAGSFASIYESHWQQAEPLSAADGPPQGVLTGADERAVMRLMAQGHGDEVIAGKLGIGPAAVEAAVSSLMERLGARNRFELGYKLARELGPVDL